MKPFLQDQNSDVMHALDSSSQLAKHAFHLNPPDSISRAKLERYLGNDQLDDLLEEVVEKHQTLIADYDVIVCEGMVSTDETSYANTVNHAIANALDAKIILVSGADLAQPEALADKLDVYARDFGGLESDKTLGVILM